MERMMKSIKALLIAALLVVALSTCSNPFDWVAKVSDEVMVAKDMYLQVIEVTPVKNEPAFSPDDPILIEFDRDIDAASVTGSSITFTPSADFSSSFDNGTNTLTITPAALSGETAYTVTVTTGVAATDRSVLRTPYAWGFTTTNAPTGSVIIKDRDNNNETYTNSTTANKLVISANGVVTQMRCSKDSFLPTDNSLVWESVAALKDPFTLNSGDGVQTVYIQFRDNPTDDHRSSVKTDTIILDTTPPVVTTLGTVPTFLNSYGWTSDSSVEESGSGIATYTWSKVAGTGSVTISPDNTLNTFVSPTAEGTVTMRLRVYDNAGNTGYLNSSSMTIDLTPPTAPNITSGPASPFEGYLPTYVWASTDATGADYFRYKFDTDASWSTETTDLTVTPSAKYGRRYFYVEERDAAGNWSNYDTWYAFVYPTWIEPYQYQTVDGSPTIRWATFPIILGTTFDVFYRKSTTSTWSQLFDNTTTLAVDLPTGALAANSTYYWYYTVTKFGTTRVPYGSDYFTFYTNSTK